MEAQTATGQAATMPAETLTQLTERARNVWSTGDFARIGARLVLVGELLCRSVDIHPGERVLDVAAGSGNAAISAARRGARVTASDFVDSLLAVAQARAEIEGLPLATAVADAQELPFEDASFDVVLSTFGAMFAPDQQRAADELVRVCRPGGRIGMANWSPGGLMCRNGAVIAKHVPPASAAAGLRRPVEWGTEARLRELFGERVSALRSERRAVDICADSAHDLVAFNRTWFGPARTAFAQLDEEGQTRLAADLTVELERFNRATDGTLVAEAEYLEVIAVRA
jgi:2-polyprenyl-3-methyl-5-hydroxy-6-metoxy-1,4-benzoquinol methylase